MFKNGLLGAISKGTETNLRVASSSQTLCNFAIFHRLLAVLLLNFILLSRLAILLLKFWKAKVSNLWLMQLLARNCTKITVIAALSVPLLQRLVCGTLFKVARQVVFIISFKFVLFVINLVYIMFP